MYFLINGTAAVYYGNTEVKKLNEGAYFGEIGCILGGGRKASIMAFTMCELRCLSRQHLNQLLGQHPS
jgi:CRP-like cAMP-binding protein